jgi:hypothetical protein
MRVSHTGGIAQAIEDGFLGRALLLGEVDEIELRGERPSDVTVSEGLKRRRPQTTLDPIGTPELSHEPELFHVEIARLQCSAALQVCRGRE